MIMYIKMQYLIRYQRTVHALGNYTTYSINSVRNTIRKQTTSERLSP